MSNIVSFHISFTFKCRVSFFSSCRPSDTLSYDPKCLHTVSDLLKCGQQYVWQTNQHNSSVSNQTVTGYLLTCIISECTRMWWEILPSMAIITGVTMIPTLAGRTWNRFLHDGLPNRYCTCTCTLYLVPCTLYLVPCTLYLVPGTCISINNTNYIHNRVY